MRRTVLTLLALMAVAWGVVLLRAVAGGPEVPVSPDATPAGSVEVAPDTATPPPGDAAEPDVPEVVGLRPVLLVPGWLDTEREMAALRIRMIGAGWPPEWVRSVTFDDPAGSNREHARELHAVARGLLRTTGADTVDIVAHSMGGLATRWYLLYEDPVPVKRVAFLATPHRGTLAAHLAWGESREEMIPDSPFLDSLGMAPPVPSDVQALTVHTPIDTHVLPGESATLPGVPDVEVCCPTHSGMLRDEEVFEVVWRFLADGPEALGEMGG